MDAVSYVREQISLENLVRLQKCHKSLFFNELSLNYKGYETAGVIRKAIESLKNKDNILRETAFQRVEEIFQNEYQRKWFNFQYQYEQALERDLIRVKRIIDYICNKEYTLIDTDVMFSFKLKAYFKNYQLHNVVGKVDFVFEKGSDVIFVNIRSGANPYSYRARKLENMVENSMELIATGIGVWDKYPGKNIRVESWYLKHKDDKAFSLMPVFEDKRGKNIASITVEDPKQLWDRLYQVAAFPEVDSTACEKCIHYSVCKVSMKVRENLQPVEEMKKKTPAATPKFTNSQRAVIDHMEGSMCVIAGPGAGKTFTLVNRLANMLKKGIRPENILFVTFTKKAANEIKTRVKDLLGTEDDNAIPNIFTFNALGYTILKENPMYLGKRIRLADKVDIYILIAEALEECPQIKNVSYDGIYSDYGLIKRLVQWFDEIYKIGKEEFHKKYFEKSDVEGILRVYDLYKKKFIEKGYINYDMQISLVNELFSKYPNLVKKYAQKYRYIMIDEFQDSSDDQAMMIYSIAKKHGNIVVVGDDDQSIYGWRGGSNKFMLNFGKDFPNSKIVLMNDNFRSTNTILESANILIENNGERYEKTLKSHKTTDYKPIYLKNCLPSSVTSLVAEILKKGYQPGDIAILARNHNRLQEVFDALDGHYKVSSPKEFLYEDTVFQAIYDVLTLYYSGMDEDEAFYRFLKLTGNINVRKHVKDESLYKNLVMLDQIIPIDKMDINCLPSYEKYKGVSSLMAAGYKLICCFKKIQYAKGLSALLDILSILFDFKEHKVIDYLLEIADERAFVTVREVYEYMGNMKLYRDNKSIEYDTRSDTINLLTSHSSKGKEFPVVIIYGTEEFKSEEEETRLLYVSITRAKNTLFLMETICNECELLPKIEGSVVLKGGNHSVSKNFLR